MSYFDNRIIYSSDFIAYNLKEGDDLARWINDLHLPSPATVETMVVCRGLLLGLQPTYDQVVRRNRSKPRALSARLSNGFPFNKA